jgi:uncharacterized protein YqgV (UPF0045/DUF77 family)
MPVPPSELTAEITVEDSGEAEESPAIAAAREAASASGIAWDTGPATTALSGARAEVLTALTQVIEAAVETGAARLTIAIEAPSQSR